MVNDPHLALSKWWQALCYSWDWTSLGATEVWQRQMHLKDFVSCGSTLGERDKTLLFLLLVWGWSVLPNHDKCNPFWFCPFQMMNTFTTQKKKHAGGYGKSANLSWSPMGFILKGEWQTEEEAAALISAEHWPCGSTMTFSTFGACSGWTILCAVFASGCPGGNVTGDRWISWFFSLSCLKESWNFSFNL